MSMKKDDEQIMIEYHDLNDIKTITVKEFNIKKQQLIDALNNLIEKEDNKNLSKYIAINFDTEQYFIPIIIAGILDLKKFAFVFNPKGNSDLFSELTINLTFSHQLLPNHDSVFELKVCQTTIHFLKCRTQKVKSENSLENLSIAPFHFLYAIGTSGTTGVPKIVEVTEECISSNISDFCEKLDVSSADKIAQLTPLSFDPSMVEILMCLKQSCTLFMVSNEVKNKPELLLQKMKQSGVTIFQTTPSLLINRWSRDRLRLLFSSGSKLRVVLLGGEPFLKPEIVSQIRGQGNLTRFFNVYGITEVSCWASLVEFCGDSEMTDFIGEPLSDTLFHVRSLQDGSVVENGEGILHIGSSKRITRIDNEEISIENLPIYRNTEDIVEIKSSKIYYKGRSDSTIKRLGHRVNLTKLETNAQTIESIEKSTAIWDGHNNKLHLIVKPAWPIYDPVNVKSELRKHLRSCLDDCYQPDEIHCINSFPLTEHGKICKSTLKKIVNQRLKPTDNLEHLLRTIWQDQLGCEMDDGFLNLGGNSISALQMSNEISDLLDLDVSKLINSFLSNAKFSDIFSLIKTELTQNEQKNERIKNIAEIGEQKTEENLQQAKISSDISDVNQLGELKCLWQKNRGDDSETAYDYRIEKIVIDKSYDLKKCVDATPTVFECSNGKKFVTVGSHSGIICTVSLNLDSAECYEIQLPDRIEASVLVLDGFRGVVGCYDGNVYCVELNTGQIVWKFQTGNMVKCTFIGCQSQQCIFVGSYDTYMYCLNIQDGEMMWRTKVSSGSLTAKPRLKLEDNLLLVTSLDGTCAALDITSGKIQWTKKFDHPIFSSPAVLKSGNVIVCTVTGNVTCINIHHNLELWTYSTGLNIFSYPIIHLDHLTGRENILVTAHDTLFCLECTDESETAVPTLRYKIKLGGPTFCTPWCEGNIVILADSTGTVQIINFYDGILLANIQLNCEIFSSPILCDDIIVIGCRDNKLYQLKILNS